MDNPRRSALDGLTVNIELTLISIIQGVALYFLTESSRQALVDRHYQYWPYILIGLLTIFTFWSRSILHTLTVIRWPLDFPHNFMYLACTLLEAVTFTQVQNPEHWFFLNAAYSVLILVLFVIDLGVIQRAKVAAGPSTATLWEGVEQDQWKNILFLNPGYIFFNVACGLLILKHPGTFLAGHWHLLLAFLQLFGNLGYLVYCLKLFQRLSHLLLTPTPDN